MLNCHKKEGGKSFGSVYGRMTWEAANIVENFGNASGVTVPTCISFNLGEQLCKTEMQLCMAGFGVGLTWSSIMMKVGNLKFNEIIDF